MSFNNDDQFSKHKDILLKPYWGSISSEGRYVITGSEFLQKTHGIDVIIQFQNDIKDATIDTKHVRGSFEKLYLEEMTNTNIKPEKPGWLLKEDGHPDFILYCMHPLCKRCFKNCSICSYSGIDIINAIQAFWFKFKRLRDWFLLNHTKYYLDINKKTINATSGRLVPIQDLVMCRQINISDLLFKQEVGNDNA